MPADGAYQGWAAETSFIHIRVHAPDTQQSRHADISERQGRGLSASHAVTECGAAGIVLDPVYSAKAVHGLTCLIQSQPEQWDGRRVLFIHTGGLLGVYDKAEQLQPLVVELGTSHRLAVED